MILETLVPLNLQGFFKKTTRHFSASCFSAHISEISAPKPLHRYYIHIYDTDTHTHTHTQWCGYASVTVLDASHEQLPSRTDSTRLWHWEHGDGVSGEFLPIQQGPRGVRHSWESQYKNVLLMATCILIGHCGRKHVCVQQTHWWLYHNSGRYYSNMLDDDHGVYLQMYDVISIE